MSKHRQHGFSLLAAIFLITVLAALGSCLVTISGVSHQTPVLALNGAQAYHAARSGLEWGIDRAINGGGACNGNVVLGRYTVTVVCTSSTHEDGGGGGTNVEVFVVNAVAEITTPSAPGDLAYASRTLTATVSDQGPQ
ncbi:MAG TPA: pilus assembly protein MshP [Gammaproteobacteria bacterium]